MAIYTSCTWWKEWAYQFLPHMHVQEVKQSVLSIVVICCRHENRCISISRYLSDLKHNESVKISKKTGFCMLQFLWYDPQVSQIVCFCWPHLSTVPTAGHVLLLMHTTGLAYVGKGRQQTYICRSMLLLQLSDWCRCSTQGMCSGELWSFLLTSATA